MRSIFTALFLSILSSFLRSFFTAFSVSSFFIFPRASIIEILMTSLLSSNALRRGGMCLILEREEMIFSLSLSQEEGRAIRRGSTALLSFNLPKASAALIHSSTSSSFRAFNRGSITRGSSTFPRKAAALTLTSEEIVLFFRTLIRGSTAFSEPR
ncbi:MAG: hypothetical protein BWY64_02056 [bacterium ADurb.Bin363]|nr:MAG: hypothetical protein BWY64_02056 [bacterium ADurb.Bin363]